MKAVIKRERWFVLKIPRSDTNEVGEYEVTVTSELYAQAERTKKQKREEKATSGGGSDKDPDPGVETQARARATPGPGRALPKRETLVCTQNTARRHKRGG